MNTHNTDPARPTDEDLANHEASHAVVWWWQANRPGADDVHYATYGGCFEKVSIEPPAAFDPGVHSGGDELLNPICMYLLAGPVSDENAGRQSLGGGARDLRIARMQAERALPGGDTRIDSYIARITNEVRELLAEPNVRAMIDALANALQIERTIGYEDAVVIMRSAAEGAK